MRGGSLTRYYPPFNRGQKVEGFLDNMIQVGAPVVMKAGLHAKSQGGTWKEAGKARGRALVHNLKRQAASMLKSGGGPVKKKKKRKAKQPVGYKKGKQKSREIFGGQ